MSTANILIVEDDSDIREGVRILLESEGYGVEEAEDGFAALKRLSEKTDLVILDVMMPGISGIKTCEEIRKRSYVPILFLTAKSQESDKLIGLMAGGDDYLSKPFRLAELRARVGAHLRRQARGPAHTRLSRGGVTFDLSARSAAVGEVPLPLTKSEYAICELLALHPGQVFGKEQIYEAVFGYDGDADESAITEHVKNIRAKLRAAGLAESPLATVWGIGYKWKEDRP